MSLKYTVEHEWVRPEGAVACVGITHHAQDALGDVVFVELPEVGSAFEQGAVAGVVESVKAAADVYMPIVAPSPRSMKPCATTLPWPTPTLWARDGSSRSSPAHPPKSMP